MRYNLKFTLIAFILYFGYVGVSWGAKTYTAWEIGLIYGTYKAGNGTVYTFKDDGTFNYSDGGGNSVGVYNRGGCQMINLNTGRSLGKGNLTLNHGSRDCCYNVRKKADLLVITAVSRNRSCYGMILSPVPQQ